MVSCYKLPRGTEGDFCDNLVYLPFPSSLNRQLVDRVVICGDFNLDPSEPVCGPLKLVMDSLALSKPVNINSPTHKNRTH